MKRNLRILSISTTLLASAMASGPADATLVTYSSLASFQAATQSPVSETYAGLAGLVVQSVTTLNGLTYTGAGATVVDPVATLTAQDWGSGAYLLFGSAAAITLTFAPTTAFGALFGSNSTSSNYDVAVSVDGNGFLTQATNTSVNLGLNFYGWTSDTPFTSVTIKGTESSPILDNVTLAVAAVPEPGSYGMMLAGLGLMGFAVRRRLRS